MTSPRTSPLLRLWVGLVVALLAAPLVGLVLRAPWSELGAVLGSPAVREALRLSLVTSALSTAGALALGLPLALWLAAREGRAARLVRALVLLPMVLPPVVGGVALLLAYGRGGWVGSPLGLALPFHLAGVVVAQTYVALPFLVFTVEAGLRGLDPRYAAAARTLGAGPRQVLWRVTLPLVAPSLGAGLLVAWARALGEFGATITFAGNRAGHTRTLPLEIFDAMQTRPEVAYVLSLCLVAVSAAVLFLQRRRWFPVR